MIATAAEYQNMKGKKMIGLFGMFDILGYRALIKNNIDYVIGLYDRSLYGIHNLALALGNNHTTDLEPSVQVKPLVFSDTFIYFQEFIFNETNFQKYQRTLAFIVYSCYLLRLAFDQGIPLRGAISFGEYYVDEKNICLLGAPVVEAYDEGRNQQWSGAVLCDSAFNIINPLLNDKELKDLFLQIKTNDECKNCNRPCIFDHNDFLIEYYIPYKESPQKGMALRWDDFMARNLLGLGGNNVNKSNYLDIVQVVSNRFHAHNKDIDSSEVEKKIENTSKFIHDVNNIYSKDFTMDEFHGSLIPRKIKQN